MRKVLLETTSNIMLLDPNSGAYIPAERPAVVEWTQFIETRVGIGQLAILAAELNDEATDEEFVEYLKESEGELELAVASFISTFGVEKPIGEKKAETAVTTPTPARKAPVKPDVA